jgi:hypothetical protein
MTSSDDVRFHLQFATVSRDSPSSEKIVCSVEDLESMVHTLREAVACLKTNVS